MRRLAVVAILVGFQSSDGLQQTDKADTWAKLNTSLMPDSNSAEGKPRFVAWLISGQVSRFIYKDSTKYIDGGIRRWSGCSQDLSQECSISVDVHIALANSHVKQFRGPQYVLPSYEDGAFEEQVIHDHYSNLRMGTKMQQKVAFMKKAFFDSGARNVRVTIVNGSEFDMTMQGVRARILTRAQVLMGLPQVAFDDFWGRLPGHENRFEQNGNMMYLRHLAYSSAVKAEKKLPYKYTHVLYTREDNIFVHPSYTLLQLAREMDHEAQPSRSPAAVLVDKRCGWHAWSDKLYFASRRGIDVLFARTLDEHIDQMATWINMSRTSQVTGDPLMTEEYFKRLLEDARTNVTKFDFLRTELRYQEVTDATNQSKTCIPEIYRNCTSVGDGFDTCPSDHPAVERAPGRYVAWLISGQVSRFIYQDSTRYIDGGIRRWSGMAGCSRHITNECNISVDVHIALANTDVEQFRGESDIRPSYEDGGFDDFMVPIERNYQNSRRMRTRMMQKVSSMKARFYNSGAREVRVTIINGSEYNVAVQRLRERTLIRAQAQKGALPRMSKSQFDFFWDLFDHNINMMYMRHLAYNSAAKAEKHLPYLYTHVLYTREDNIFVHPPYTLLQLARDMDSDEKDGPRSRAVLVDRVCEPDSVYFASRRGFDALVASSSDGHEAMMARWLNVVRTSKDGLAPPADQIQEYLTRELEALRANVTMFDFFHVHGRYVVGAEKACVPDVYKDCTSLPEFESCPSA